MAQRSKWTGNVRRRDNKGSFLGSAVTRKISFNSPQGKIEKTGSFGVPEGTGAIADHPNFGDERYKMLAKWETKKSLWGLQQRLGRGGVACQTVEDN